MPRSKKLKTVAQKFPLLYAFAAFSIFLNVIGVLLSYFYTDQVFNKQVLKSSGLDQHFVHQSMILGIIFSVLLYGAQAIYLTLSKNFKGVYLLCKIILVLDLIGACILPFAVFGNRYGYNAILKIYITVSVVAQLVVLIKILRQLSKAKVRELRYAPAQPKSKFLRKIPKNYVPPKPILLPNTFTTVLKVILRIIAGSWALVTIFIGVLVSFGPSAHPITLGIPLILVGILYLTPYYVLNKKLNVVYTCLLIIMTATLVLLLHLPLKNGLPAPAGLPAPILFNHSTQTIDVVASYAFIVFHSQGFIVPISLLIVTDSILGIVKYSALSDNAKQALKMLMLSGVILSLIVLLGVAQNNASKRSEPDYRNTNYCSRSTLHIGQVRLTYCSSTPNFISSKYQFGIDFPKKPGEDDCTTRLDKNDLLPCTDYSVSLNHNTQIYSVFAYNWPNQGNDFIDMSESDLKTSLKSFINTDVQALDAKLISLKYKQLFKGQTIAAEAKFSFKVKNGTVYGYITEFTYGYYEYDIETQGVSQLEHDSFINSFKYYGYDSSPPDNSSDSIGNVSGSPTNGTGPGKSTVVNRPSDVPSDGSVSGEPTDTPDSTGDGSINSDKSSGNINLQLQ